jgi:Mg2+-importing ATPase
MLHLTQILGKPVVDVAGYTVGTVSDMAVTTGDVFPRVTALAFLGPDKTPFMLSWRKYVSSIGDEKITLSAARTDLRFSYLQPDEILLARDLLNKEIVDTQGKKVVRVYDLDLSEGKNQLRLLGAEVGIRGFLRRLSPRLERAGARLAALFGRTIPDDLIAWNYMDLLDRNLSHVRLSVTHKRLNELHPADIADVLEQLSPPQRAKVFEHLDNASAARAVAELEDEYHADVIDSLGSERASDLLEMMDPDDAADIIGDLPYEKAQALLRLMGVSEAQTIRSLLGYRKNTAGGLMNPSLATVPQGMTAGELIDHLRDNPSAIDESQHLYVVDDEEDYRLIGRVSLRDVITAIPIAPLREIALPYLVTVGPDEDQEQVAEIMTKYDLLSVPVVDESGVLLGVVTIDDIIELVQRVRSGRAPAGPAKAPPRVEERDLLLQVANVGPSQALSVLEAEAGGLHEDAAQRRLGRYGENTVTRRKRLRWYVQFVRSFVSPFNAILAVLAVVSYIIDVQLSDEPSYAKIIILLIMIAVGSLVRFFQEHRSAVAAAGLESIIQTSATVLRRKGEERLDVSVQDLLAPDVLRNTEEIPVERLVPGDIVFLSAGDMVPADVRLLVSKDLFVSEASLTGESLPVEKHAQLIRRSLRDLPSSALEAETLCFMGTSITSGSAAAVVVATGGSTYLGVLGQALAKTPGPTAFDQGVRRVSWVFIGFMAAMTPAVFLINWLTKGDLLGGLLFALAVAVGLTPEMLPMIVSTNLAKGSLLLSRHKVIVKQGSAIQNLGGMDVLCTDKTGTLTENHVVLRTHLDLEGEESPEVLRLAYINSYFQTGLRNLLDEAVVEYATEAEVTDITDELMKVDEIAFDFSRKRLSVVVRDQADRELLVCKGAVENVLELCTAAQIGGESVPLTTALRREAFVLTRRLNEKGMRILAVARREIEERRRRYSADDEQELVLVGLIGFLDPPKETTAAAVAGLQKLGVEVKVLTGDNEVVTRAICEQVGISVKRALTGPEIERLSDGELRETLRLANVLAKLTPLQKARVVRLLQDQGKTVGFMGDGINDSAALLAADVGISVDSAVDIARESADIILLEKSLTVLERGIVEGRKVFVNTMKYIKITASSNFGNVFSIILASIFLPFLPMLPLQILFLNLIYDLSCVFMTIDKVDDEFVEKPKRWEARGLARFMVYMGPVSSVYDLVTFAVMFFAFAASTAAQQSLFQTGWFVVSMCTQVLVIQMLRTGKIPFVQSTGALPTLLAGGVAIAIACAVPFTAVGRALGLTALPAVFWPVLIAIVGAYLVHAQLVKWAYRRRFEGDWL